jgi:hypothetical protein
MATKNGMIQNIAETNGYHNVTNGNVENGEYPSPPGKPCLASFQVPLRALLGVR